jgi:cytidylate kinase
MSVITLSRQPGSQGPQVARMVAQQLGLELVEREHLHQMAQQCDTEYAAACRLYEEEEFAGVFERLMINRPAYRALFESLHYELAARGGVVILGRGGHIALKDAPAVVRIRLVADREVRIQRIMEQKQMDRQEAETFVDHFTQRHKAVIHAIFDRDIADPLEYDLVVNTTGLTAQQAAAVVCRLVEVRQSRGPLPEMQEKMRQMAFVKRLEARVHKQVYLVPYLPFAIEMPAPGQVTLSGCVAERHQIETIEKIVADAEGVNGVDNRLRALGRVEGRW